MMQKSTLTIYLILLSINLICLSSNADRLGDSSTIDVANRNVNNVKGGTRFGLSDEEADEINDIAINGEKQQPAGRPSPAMIDRLRQYDWTSGMTLQQLEDGDVGSDYSDYEEDHEPESDSESSDEYFDNGTPVRRYAQEDNQYIYGPAIPREPDMMDSEPETDDMDIDEPEQGVQYNGYAQPGNGAAFLERSDSQDSWSSFPSPPSSP